MSDFRLQVDLPCSGWISATVSAHDSIVEIPASRLSDAPGDLARAARILIEGSRQVRVSWQDEPGELRWVLRRDGERLEVTIIRFKDTFSKQDDREGEVLLGTECDVLRFAAQVKGQLHVLLNQLGEGDYAARWGRPFPRTEFDSLTELIRQHKRGKESG